MQNLLVIAVVLIVFSAALVGYNQLDASNTRSEAIKAFIAAWNNTQDGQARINAAKTLIDIYGTSRPWFDNLPLATNTTKPQPELCQQIEKQIIAKTSFRSISAEADILSEASKIIDCP